MNVGRSQKAMQLLICFILACLGSLAAKLQTTEWLEFHDSQTGLTFRYPPNLRVRNVDAQKFGLPDVERIVELTGDTKLNPDTIVLRFLVKRGYTSADERAKILDGLRNACTTTSFLTIDGHQAAVCVWSGRAAVHWKIEILQPRQCTIISLLTGADAEQALPPPHDGEFPLLTIIRTVRFTSPGPSVR